MLNVENEKITDYIDQLYEKKAFVKKESFTSYMQLKKYIPTVNDQEACFLRLLIRLIKPRKILEIGTSVGFSTASMALAAKEYGGRITTIEFDDKAADQAERNFIKTGVSDYINILKGDAVKILHDLNDTYDLIFQDVDKRLYPVLLDDCIRLLNKNGVLLSDDVLFPVIELDEIWNNQIEPISEYNKKIISHSQLESVLLPIGDGIMMSVKK